MKFKNKIKNNLDLLPQDICDITSLLLYLGSSKVLFGNINLLNYVWLLKILKL